MSWLSYFKTSLPSNESLVIPHLTTRMTSPCEPVQQSMTRLRHDPFHQVDDMRISSYAARYYLSPPAANCPVSFPVEPTIRLQKSGASWVDGEWKTDVESDLKGIPRLSSKIRCDSMHYHPDTNATNQTRLAHAPDEITAPMTFARLVDPPCTLRATGWNRWQPLFHNPQETFETPFDFFIPSRQLDKERYNTHRPASETCFTPCHQPPLTELGGPSRRLQSVSPNPNTRGSG